MPRIAFLSCVRMRFEIVESGAEYPCKIDVNDFEQPIWNQLLKQHREKAFSAFLLLGDQVYSDYGAVHGGGNRPLGWTVDHFHAHMYKMYKTQYENAAGFKELLRALKDSGCQIGMTWDDHDFGYNNSEGSHQDFHDKLESTKLLFEQFLSALRNVPNAYPSIPALQGHRPKTGIEQITAPIRLPENIEIATLDSRFYRHQSDGQLWGADGGQWGQLSHFLSHCDSNTLQLLCSGSTYSVSGELADQSWLNAKGKQNNLPLEYFAAFNHLVESKTQKTLFLSGDIHRNEHHSHLNGRLQEIISSGAYLPRRFLGFLWKQKPKSNFGILDINATQIHAQLFSEGEVSHKFSASRV